jgi:phosphopantothenoylcysteine decarboxylase/phosphopantothenate--cysteine ligase
MNADMWQSPIVQRNLATLGDLLGVHTVGPAEGWQACRTSGPGRMAEPDDIVAAVVKLTAR